MLSSFEARFVCSKKTCRDEEHWAEIRGDDQIAIEFVIPTRGIDYNITSCCHSKEQHGGSNIPLRLLVKLVARDEHLHRLRPRGSTRRL